ncbi:uncharacterized protein [Clytia hemisphaerica]|uniref:uncharacterized protein n=1 Tax=Clytia hemisphaerica TaxID=252671 RepID=UPI0034D69DE9
MASMQLSLFYTDVLALSLVTLLSVDRMTAMLFPIRHHNGIITKREKQLLIMAWSLAFLFEVPYFLIGFINQFAVVAFTIIGAAGISLIITTLLYKFKLQPKECNSDRTQANKQRQSVQERNMKTSVSQIKFECSEGNESPKALVRMKKNSIADTQSPKIHNQKQANATKAFMFILVLFMTTYVPAHSMIMYMLTCTKCDCDIVHAMKNLSQLTILASSLMRPLGFVCSLTHLRASVIRLVKRYIT